MIPLLKNVPSAGSERWFSIHIKGVRRDGDCKAIKPIGGNIADITLRQEKREAR